MTNSHRHVIRLFMKYGNSFQRLSAFWVFLHFLTERVYESKNSTYTVENVTNETEF